MTELKAYSVQVEYQHVKPLEAANLKIYGPDKEDAAIRARLQFYDTHTRECQIVAVREPKLMEQPK